MATRKEFEEWYWKDWRTRGLASYTPVDAFIGCNNAWLSYCEKKGISPKIE